MSHSQCSDRLGVVESWATEVLPVLAGNDGDDEDEAAAQGSALYPSLTRPNFVHYFRPFLVTCAAEFERACLGACLGSRAGKLKGGSGFGGSGSGEPPARAEVALLLRAHRLVCALGLALVMTRVPGLQSAGVLLAALREGRRFVELFLKATPALLALLHDHQVTVVRALAPL